MSGFVKTPTERELEILKHRLDKLETRVEVTETFLENSLGSSVPPSSESALRGKCPECHQALGHTEECSLPHKRLRDRVAALETPEQRPAGGPPNDGLT